MRLWATPLAATLFLTIIFKYSFLTFHTLTELFTILVAFSLFAFSWSMRDKHANTFLLFLACGYIWIGALDLMHTLTYKGMDVFVEGNDNLTVQFWLSARYSESLLFFAAPFATKRKHNAYLLVVLFGAIAAGLAAMILLGQFPVSFVEGKGLTNFKIYSEYLIIFIFAAALAALFRHGAPLTVEEKSLVAASIVMTIFAEFSFTLYADVYGFRNFIGHIFKFFSFWFIFQAIVRSNLQKPYWELQKSEERARNLFENSDISIWDEDLSNVCAALHKLKLDGVEDLRKHLKDNQHIVLDLIRSVKINRVNKATLKLFGANNEAELIHKIDRIFGPGSVKVFADELCAIWDQKPTFRSEAHFKTLNGRPFQAIVSFEPPATQDRFQSIPVSVVDITEHRQQLAFIQESEQRYRQMFAENAAVFLIINPENGAIVNASVGACRYYGYSLIELATMNISDINTMLPDEIAGEMERAKSKKKQHFNFRHRLASGEVRDVEAYSNPVTVNGRTLLYSIIHDISDRRLLEDGLRQQTYELRVRAKELNCLHSISKIFHHLNTSDEEAIKMVLDALPIGEKFPEIGSALITVDVRHFTTERFQETPWKQSAPIFSSKKESGVVEFFYLNETPEFHEGPLVGEARFLVEDIAISIGTFLNIKQGEAERIKTALALKKAFLSAINAVAATIEKRDPYTSGHQKKVALLAVTIAEDLGWSEFQIEGIRLGATIHDIGKIYVPAEILNRPGKLSAPEFEMIKSHPQVGYDILEGTDFPWPIREMVRQHHERIDGSGYPDGLKGEQIVDGAKVIAVADVVEAISAHRPYREALGIEQGLKEIERGRGTIYDPKVVDSCIKIIRSPTFNWPNT